MLMSEEGVKLMSEEGVKLMGEEEIKLHDYLAQHAKVSSGYYMKITSVVRNFRAHNSTKLTSTEIKKIIKEGFPPVTRRVRENKGKKSKFYTVKDILPITIEGRYDFCDNTTPEYGNDSRKKGELSFSGYVTDIHYKDNGDIVLYLLTRVTTGEAENFLITADQVEMVEAVKKHGTSILGEHLRIEAKPADSKQQEDYRVINTYLVDTEADKTTNKIRNSYAKKYHWIAQNALQRKHKPAPLAKKVDNYLKFEATKYIKDDLDRKQASQSKKWYSLYDLANQLGMTQGELDQFVIKSKLGTYYSAEHANDYYGLLDLAIEHEGNTKIVRSGGENLQLFSQSFKVLLKQAQREYSLFLKERK